jgi:hypothetical protein
MAMMIDRSLFIAALAVVGVVIGLMALGAWLF